MKLFKIILTTALAAGISSSVYAQQAVPQASAAPTILHDIIHHIGIKGNQRVEETTIATYLGLKEGAEFTQYDIDTALKNLFATGFFCRRYD